MTTLVLTSREALGTLPERVEAAFAQHQTVTVHYDLDRSDACAGDLVRQHRAAVARIAEHGGRFRVEGRPWALRLLGAAEARLLAGPETLQVNLASACQLDCLFCWNHFPLVQPRSAAWHRQRMSDEHLDAVTEGVRRLRPGNVLLSGRGDPLLHPRIPDLLDRLGRLAVPVSIQTNLLGLDDPTRLWTWGVRRLLVNLSAATEQAYAEVHPGRGSAVRFRKVVESLTRIVRLRREHDSRWPELHLTYVICRKNHTGLADMARLAARIGADALFFKVAEHAPQVAGTMLNRSHLAPCVRSVREAESVAKRHGLHMDVDRILVHLDQLEVETGRFTHRLYDQGGIQSCYMGWYYLRVAVDGRVAFCCKDKWVGHLDDPGGLYELWRGMDYQSLRLAARDMDRGIAPALIDEKCGRCSNFAQNLRIHHRLVGD